MYGQTASIRHVLERLRAAVAQERLSQLTAAKAKAPGDPRQTQFWDKLGGWEAELHRLLRQLVARHASLEHERGLLWRIPRANRYPARQSVEDREAVTLDLVELAETTLRELADLYGDAAAMRPGDWECVGEDAVRMVGKLQQASVHAVVQQMQKGPAFSAVNAHPLLGIDALAPLVGLLIALIARRRGKASTSRT